LYSFDLYMYWICIPIQPLATTSLSRLGFSSSSEEDDWLSIVSQPFINHPGDVWQQDVDNCRTTRSSEVEDLTGADITTLRTSASVHGRQRWRREDENWRRQLSWPSVILWSPSVLWTKNDENPSVVWWVAHGTFRSRPSCERQRTPRTSTWSGQSASAARLNILLSSTTDGLPSCVFVDGVVQGCDSQQCDNYNRSRTDGATTCLVWIYLDI